MILGIVVLVIALILWVLKVAVNLAVFLGLVGLVVLIISLFRRKNRQSNH
jgi:hypothetical protein